MVFPKQLLRNMAGNCMKIRKKSFFYTNLFNKFSPKRKFGITQTRKKSGVAPAGNEHVRVRLHRALFKKTSELNKIAEQFVVLIDFREINIEIPHVSYQHIIVISIL